MVKVVLSGIVREVSVSRWIVRAICQASASYAPELHGAWAGEEDAARFAESMGQGRVVRFYLDGTRWIPNVPTGELPMRYVEAREVQPYLYAHGWGRLSADEVREIVPQVAEKVVELLGAEIAGRVA